MKWVTKMMLQIKITDSMSINVDLLPTLHSMSDEQLASFRKEMLDTIRAIEKKRNHDYLTSR